MPISRQASGAASGDIKPWPGASAPAGWLKCNGAAVSRTLYAALFNVIGTTYGAGDGSTTFNLPDLRGEFVRGLDDGRGVDASRTLGTSQGDAFGSHSHSGSTDTHSGHQHNTGGGSTTGGTIPQGGTLAVSATGTPTAVSGAHSHALTINAAGGTETRPRNQALLYVIKF